MAYIGRDISNLSDRVVLDNITASATATYNLLLNSVAYVPSSAESLTVSLNGVIQKPQSSYTVSGSQITFASALTSSDSIDFILAERSITLQTPSAGSVGLTQLSATGTKDATTFLRGDNTFATVSSTTINNNADNRVITGSGTANTLEGESSLTWNGSSLGVGLASPETTAHIQSASGECELRLTAASTSDARLRFGDTTTTAGGYIGYNRSTQNMYIRSANSGAAHVNIASNGDLIQGTDSTGNDGRNFRFGSSVHSYRSGTVDAYHYVFFNANGEIGRIRTSGTTTAYNTSSDYRLKENEVAISDGIERLKQLKPYRFNFKTDADTTVDGFFAHEVSSVVPEAIDGIKDATNEDGSIKPQAIDQSKLVPLLTSALQEAITKIETLEAKVEALENA